MEPDLYALGHFESRAQSSASPGTTLSPRSKFSRPSCNSAEEKGPRHYSMGMDATLASGPTAHVVNERPTIAGRSNDTVIVHQPQVARSTSPPLEERGIHRFVSIAAHTFILWRSFSQLDDIRSASRGNLDARPEPWLPVRIVGCRLTMI